MQHNFTILALGTRRGSFSTYVLLSTVVSFLNTCIHLGGWTKLTAVP